MSFAVRLLITPSGLLGPQPAKCSREAGIVLLSGVRTNHHHQVETSQFIRMKTETLTDQPLQSIAVDRFFQLFLGDGQAKAR